MDKRKKLEELESKYHEFGISMKDLQMEITSFEGTPDHEKYMSYTEDIVKQTMYPKEYAIYKQRDELVVKVEAFYKEIINSVIDLNKEITEKINELENKLETNKQYIESLEQKIEKLQSEINELKETEEYKNGDEATLLKVEELEGELKSKVEMKEKLSTKVASIEEELEQAKEEKQKIIDEYGYEIEQLTQVDAVKDEELVDVPNVSEETAEKSAPGTSSEEATPVQEETGEESSKENKDNKDNKTQNKTARTGKTAGTTYAVADEPNKEVDSEEQMQKDFAELYNKAKRGALTDKDFDRFSEIMKNPENYDKLGITTGLVFNKAKVIFKAMAKTASINGFNVKNADEKLEEKLAEAKAVVEQDRESLSEEEQIKWDNANKHLKQYEQLKLAMGAYAEVSKKRMQDRWSWLIEFEDSKPALPEKTAEQSPVVESSQGGKDSFSETLASQTVDAPDYTEVAVEDEPAKESNEIMP